MYPKKISNIGWFYVLLIGLWVVVISFIGLASLPLNPLSLKRSKQISIASVLPEGWGFFTRSPREPSILLFQAKDGQYQLVNKTAGDKSYLFGLARTSRSISDELRSMVSNISDSAWQYVNKTGD